ncbi:MAG: cupin domain-containing protein [Hyphomonadaceae bacterium]|nr:cupin domain-containing protein [Hyphomonadaceae bacterium]
MIAKTNTAAFLVALLAATACATAPPTPPTPIPPPPPPKIVIVGDSTASDYGRERYPRMGWGMALHCELDAAIAVDNRAVSGRSTKSFRDEGHWDAAVAALRPGDVMLIQFGHNDQKIEDPTRYVAPDGPFAANLTAFITEVRARGATPVLVTPVVRRKFVDGRLVDTLGPYVGVVREVAAATATPLVDLQADSAAYVDGLGPEGSKRIYLHYGADMQYAPYPQGVTDDAHFSETGARVMAGFVAQRLAALETPVRAHVRPRVEGYDRTVALGSPRCAGPARPMVVVDENAVRREEPPPHGAIGTSTAYRLSDAAPARQMEFRKRTLARGAAIGLHPIEHDEVYYVVSGEGVVTSDGVSTPLRAGMAAYLYDGAVVGIRQTGSAPLTLIIAYPLDARTP